MTYVATYYQYFSKMKQVEVSGSRIQKVSILADYSCLVNFFYEFFIFTYFLPPPPLFYEGGSNISKMIVFDLTSKWGVLLGGGGWVDSFCW